MLRIITTSQAKLQHAGSPGQTLIETVVAIFMLVMGITAALGLAIYALNSSTSITKEIIATGLARQGIETVKDMRDTNWLSQATPDSNCYNFVDGTQTAKCYKDWLGDHPLSVADYCLNPSSGGSCNGGKGTDTFYIAVDSTKNNSSFWTLVSDNSKFGLNFNASSTPAGFYTSPNGGVTCQNATSDYCRKIILTLDFTAPYNHPAGTSPTYYDTSDVGPMLKVQSQVWWVDKKCPRVSDYSLAPNGCRYELDAYLTNWKTY